MNELQQKMFLVSNAAMWSWLTPSGVWLARSLHEERTKWRVYPGFKVLHYPWLGDRYGRVRTVVDEVLGSNYEADSHLLPLVGRPFAEVAEQLKAEVVEGPLPSSVLYRKGALGYSWHEMTPTGLRAVHIRRRHKNATQSLGVSFRPFDMTKRWYSLHKVETGPNQERWEQMLQEFDWIVRNGTDEYLMAERL